MIPTRPGAWNDGMARICRALTTPTGWRAFRSCSRTPSGKLSQSTFLTTLHSVGVVAIIILHAGCREPSAQAAASELDRTPASLRLHVGDRWRYCIDIVIDEDSSWGGDTHTRYQLDAVVEVVAVSPGRIVTREEFERTFGESDSISGWESFDGFATQNVFDADGSLISRSQTSSHARWRIEDLGG